MTFQSRLGAIQHDRAAVERFNLERALFDTAMQNIAVRARQRRLEAIHDAMLILSAGISMALTAFGAVWLWLLVNGRF